MAGPRLSRNRCGELVNQEIDPSYLESLESPSEELSTIDSSVSENMLDSRSVYKASVW